MRALAVAGALLVTQARGPAAQSTLSVKVGQDWHSFWRSDSAPSRWSAPSPVVTAALQWQPVAAGVSLAQLSLAGTGEAWRTRAVVVRLLPDSIHLALQSAYDSEGIDAAWTIDSAPANAIVAFNAGQFNRTQPWGWVVQQGRERHMPSRGNLSAAFIEDEAGHVAFVSEDSIAFFRTLVKAHVIAEAFQSYPVLLAAGGAVPRALREARYGLDLRHRDARLAIGIGQDGALYVVLTRFDALGEALGAIPFGLTVPETAGLMGAIGCERAMMLDGGTSAQLLVRSGPGDSQAHLWRGLRRVPLGLLVTRR